MLAARDELLDCFRHRALVVNQHEPGARSVVADAEAGRFQTLGRHAAVGLTGSQAHGTNNELYLLAADAAGTVDNWRLRGDVDDRGFHADLGRSCIEDGVDAAIEIALHVGGGRRAGGAEAVGAGRGNRHSGGFNQGQRHGVRRNANADFLAPGGAGVGNYVVFGQQQRERSRHEACRQLLRGLRPRPHQGLGHRKRAGMHDDRVPGRPLLGLEDAQHRLAVQCVAPEPVHGFGGECD